MLSYRAAPVAVAGKADYTTARTMRPETLEYREVWPLIADG